MVLAPFIQLIRLTNWISEHSSYSLTPPATIIIDSYFGRGKVFHLDALINQDVSELPVVGIVDTVGIIILRVELNLIHGVLRVDSDLHQTVSESLQSCRVSFI